VSSSGAHRLSPATVPTWAWLAGVLLTVVMAGIGAWATSVEARALRQAIRLEEQQQLIQARVVAETELRAKLERLSESQDRTFRLLVKVAKRQGIEVAE
jgi:hypothetical protein